MFGKAFAVIQYLIMSYGGSEMKNYARAVVIGGGIAGCSTLYHLTKLGWSDVVLVEKMN